MKILVTGANGQLGNEFRALCTSDARHSFLFVGRSDLDITNLPSVNKLLGEFMPDVIINCAAYTQVDRAEDAPEEAYLVNEYAVGLLAHVAKSINAKLIHYSTDYVYDKLNADEPLNENDRCQPRSVYGKSKLAGEQIIKSSGVDYIIVRVSWLYSTYNNNFVKTMLRLGREREEISVVSDQIGTPTYATDLARATMQIIDSDRFIRKNVKDIYNYSNSGVTNWNTFASKIFKIANIHCEVKEISTEKFGAKAPRPLWSVMSKEKIIRDYQLFIPHWEESLSVCLEVLLSKS